MRKNHNVPESSTELRRRAELQVEEGLGPAAGSPAEGQPTTTRLLHELQVHQIELELQNEELQRTSAALEKALARYSDLFERAPIGYLTLAHDGEIQQINIAGTRLLGRMAAQLVGKRLGAFIATESLPALNAFLRRVWGSVTESGCELVTRVDGSESRTLALTGTARGYIACAIVDVTERKRAETALVRSQMAYRQLFEDNPVPMCVVDAVTTAFLAANDPFLALYGFGREALLAMRFADLRKVGAEAWAPGFTGTAVHRTSLGTDIHVELSAHDLPFGGRAARLVAVKNVTAQQRLEEQLRHS